MKEAPHNIKTDGPSAEEAEAIEKAKDQTPTAIRLHEAMGGVSVKRRPGVHTVPAWEAERLVAGGLASHLEPGDTVERGSITEIVEAAVEKALNAAGRKRSPKKAAAKKSAASA